MRLLVFFQAYLICTSLFIELMIFLTRWGESTFALWFCLFSPLFFSRKFYSNKLLSYNSDVFLNPCGYLHVLQNQALWTTGLDFSAVIFGSLFSSLQSKSHIRGMVNPPETWMRISIWMWGLDCREENRVVENREPTSISVDFLTEFITFSLSD